MVEDDVIYNHVHKSTLKLSRSCDSSGHFLTFEGFGNVSKNKDFSHLQNRKSAMTSVNPFMGLKTSHQLNSEGKSF